MKIGLFNRAIDGDKREELSEYCDIVFSNFGDFKEFIKYSKLKDFEIMIASKLTFFGEDRFELACFVGAYFSLDNNVFVSDLEKVKAYEKYDPRIKRFHNDEDYKRMVTCKNCFAFARAFDENIESIKRLLALKEV